MTFRDFLGSLGLQPATVDADGKWRRCRTADHPRKKNGSFKLAADGLIGWAINYATMTNVATWRAAGATDVPEYDPRALTEARNAQRRQLIAATRAAREFYESCEPLRGGHPYLESHQLDMQGCFGLRVDRDGRTWHAALNDYRTSQGDRPVRWQPTAPGGFLIVPAYRSGQLVSVQRIAPDGTKLYYPGASTKGVSYTIERAGAPIHVVCEGLATGLALFAAVPLARVVVAFTTSGLLTAAENLPAGLAVICADNDRATEARIGTNPGVDAAQKASEATGAGVAIPTCTDGTDWCDYRNELYAERVQAWNRKPHETEASIRRAVDAQIAGMIQRAARFRAPPIAAGA